MRGSAAVSLKVKIICEKCGQPYEIEGSHSSVAFNLRIKQAKCPHCNHQRTPVVIEQGSFQCHGPCGLIYRVRKHWRPVKGKCMTCYMREYRAKKRS